MQEIIHFSRYDRGKDPLNYLHHTHGASYEILFVHQGQGNIVLKNRLFPLRAGVVYFINGAETHCSAPLAPDDYVRSKIVIAADFVTRIAEAAGCRAMPDALFDNGSCFLPREEEAAYINGQFAAMNAALKAEGPHTSACVAAGLLGLMYMGYGKPSAELLAKDSETASALAYIDQNLSAKLCLGEIAQHCHLSTYYLCHTFKRHTGMSVFAYILSRRLAVAKRQLAETEKSISQIACDCGFTDFSYFSRAFRSCYGQAPSEFRRFGLKTK